MTELEESQQALASVGILAPWYLYPPQKDIYIHLHQHKYPTIECSRRFGKTTTCLVFVDEYLRLNPGHYWRWCEPEKNQAREIVIPEMEKIQKLNFPDKRAEFKHVDSYYQYPNGSRLYLRGVNMDKGESARGTFAHGITCDELGSWRDPDYIINEVLIPQLLTTNGPLHRISTPPRDLGHKWYDYKAQAIEDNTFLQKTVHEITWISKDLIEKIKKEVGGENSPAWKREFLCEPVADPESLIIPEFDEHKHIGIQPRPPYIDTYVAADFGFQDHTGIIIGYYDFKQAKLIIEDEIWKKGASSKDLIEDLRTKEKQLYGSIPIFSRVADAPLQQLHDISVNHGVTFNLTMKDDKVAAINGIRLGFGSGRVLVSPKCTNLIFQLKVGMWNDRKTDFQRGDGVGHLDLISALVYLWRNIHFHKNPYPEIADNVLHKDYFIQPSENNSDIAKALYPFSKGKA